MAEFPLAPGSTIGVLGGGQLGRMLALAAARLSFDVVILTPELDSCASRVAARTLLAEYEDERALEALASACDVITFEFENVPAGVVETLNRLGVAVAPGAMALAIGEAGATNAGLLAARILSLSDAGLAARLQARAKALEASISESVAD